MPHDTLDADLQGLPLWDATALARAVGDNPAIHKRLLAKYLDSAVVSVSAIADSAATRNWLSVSEQAHKLKSASRAVGAMRLGALCEALEREGRSADGEGCVELVQAVSAGFEAVASQINAHR